MEFYNLSIYDPNTKKPLYTKFNFNFDEYKIDFNISSEDKNVIFSDFWNRNGFDYSTQYSIKDELIKYFTPINDDVISNYINAYGFIHTYYVALVKPKTFIDYNILFENQYDIIYYTNDEISILQDFYYDDSSEIYSKYNFDFTNYSKDFNIYGSNLLLFTDFIIRNHNLSGSLPNTNSYGLYTPFKKYFYNYTNDTLINYLNNYSVTSVLGIVYKNLNNIDFSKLISLNPNIKDVDPSLVKLYYLTSGQFELLNIPFIQKIESNLDLAKESSCIVITNESYSSGFLYNYPNDDKYYLISCYHLVKDTEDEFYIYASLQSKDPNNIINSEATTAQFRIIGIDRKTDIIVALFDPTLPFNIENNIDISSYPKLSLNIDYQIKNGDEIVSIGNSANDDIQTPIFGKIINNNYGGPFSDFDRAPSFLLELYLSSRSSGSPVLYYDPNNNTFELIGMVISKLKTSPQLSIAISGYILYVIINIMINNYEYYEYIYAKDLVKLNNAIKFGYQTSWFGTNNNYYFRLHPSYNDLYKELHNLNYDGGIIIDSFMLGYNYIENKIITTVKDLNKKNIFKLEGPLLNSKLYSNFVKSNNVVVLKTLSYFDCSVDSFIKINLGKFSNQVPLTNFYYGFAPIGVYANDPKYANYALYQYPLVRIEYYWYNGSVWVLEQEFVGGNTPDWYVEYEDNNGNIYYQHKFEFPIILLDFIKYFQSHVMENSQLNQLLAGGYADPFQHLSGVPPPS
jgi:hypothetical protein